MALDKTIPKRTYLNYQYAEVDLKASEDNNIYFDNEWLSILRTFNEYLPFDNSFYDFSDYMNNVNK